MLTITLCKKRHTYTSVLIQSTRRARLVPSSLQCEVRAHKHGLIPEKMLHLNGVRGGGAGPQSPAFSPASEPQPKETKEMRYCLLYLSRSTLFIIQRNVSFSQKIRDVSLQSIKGSTSSHNSKANTKYSKRGTVLKGQVFLVVVLYARYYDWSKSNGAFCFVEKDPDAAGKN